MKQELWLSRDIDGDYSVSDVEPEKNEYGYFHPFLEAFASDVFQRMFTARIRRGRKKRIKRILIELED